MLSNAYFLAKFRFDTAENEPAKNLQNFAKFANFADPNPLSPATGVLPERVLHGAQVRLELVELHGEDHLGLVEGVLDLQKRVAEGLLHRRLQVVL